MNIIEKNKSAEKSTNMYIVEGNIGAGKSTFLNELHKNMNPSLISLEAVKEWENNDVSHSILHSFYDNPERWGYSMEINTLAHRSKQHIFYQSKKELCFLERSIYSGYHCFAYHGYSNGKMSTLEWSIYKEYFSFVLKRCLPPKGFIYLRTSPEVAFSRVKRRGRDSEKNISFFYLNELHKLYDDFMLYNAKHESLKHIPILVIDSNEEWEKKPYLFKQYFQKIKYFINENASRYDIKNMQAKELYT